MTLFPWNIPLSLPYRRAGKAKRDKRLSKRACFKQTLAEQNEASVERLSTVPHNGTKQSFYLEKSAVNLRHPRRRIAGHTLPIPWPAFGVIIRKSHSSRSPLFETGTTCPKCRLFRNLSVMVWCAHSSRSLIARRETTNPCASLEFS
jgi:hypothetical protein